MAISKFGEQLRKLRFLCRHPETGKQMTQSQFAEFLYTEIDILYSNTAISDWEIGKSRIDVNDRRLLCAIIKILKQLGGVKALSDANFLLELGDYRALNQEETKILFPESISDEQENESPVPAWAEKSVSTIRKFTDSLSVWHFVKIIAWAWIFLITYWLILPSLQFPFIDKEVAVKNMYLYVMGTLFIPLAIGGMTNIKNNLYWKEQNIQKPLNLWLYMFQGAYVGFHVGYFLMFFLKLMLTQFNFQSAAWFEIIKILFILIVSYASAHLVPYNLWRAYQRLELSDGWIFFVFVIFGIGWAFFFLEYYEMLISPILGTIMILISISIVIVIGIFKKRK
ncbi:MAG: helix-turn-helix transcriptional regulator [Anaerolineales bacterium]|nr:helix-turn-helix transcriptional regulator [Anaerolineales bacterium]